MSDLGPGAPEHPKTDKDEPFASMAFVIRAFGTIPAVSWVHDRTLLVRDRIRSFVEAAISATAPELFAERPMTEQAVPFARFARVMEPEGSEIAPEAVRAPVETLVGVMAPKDRVNVPEVVIGLPVTPMPLFPVTATEVTEPLPVPAPRFALAPAAVVAPVPPDPTASVPAMVRVPAVVTGPPEKVSPVEPPEASTEVTVPTPPPDMERVSVPAPGVRTAPDPATRLTMPGKLARSSGAAP